MQKVCDSVLCTLWIGLPVLLWFHNFGADLLSFAPRAGNRTGLIIIMIPVGAWFRVSASLLRKTTAPGEAPRKGWLNPYLLDLPVAASILLLSSHTRDPLVLAAVFLGYGALSLGLGLVVLGPPARLRIVLAIFYLLAGAFLLLILGPGIAPVDDRLGRAVLGALMSTLAWLGWTALYPTTRKVATGCLKNVLLGGAGAGAPRGR